jgi:cytochrome c-type biogenesis protein CcmH
MSLTVLGWLFVVSSIAISALLIFPRLRSSIWRFGLDPRGAARPLLVAAAAFLLVAGIGAVASHMEVPPEAAGAGDTTSFSPPQPESNDDVLARLTDYTRSVGSEEAASKAETGDVLPDTDTMIERLAARLETTPDDIEGWRMLGWSYFHTARYQQAASAYARAVALDPNSAELERSYAEAKAKAAESGNSAIASSSPNEAIGTGASAPSAENTTQPPPEHDAMVRSMVDGLADRLESSPQDVEGWALLMRSRVVLGEREVAETTFRKALEIFKDDPAASEKIRAAAIGLGLKGE